MDNKTNLPPELSIHKADFDKAAKLKPKTGGPLEKVPTAPKGLSKDAKADWRKICQLLLDDGNLAKRDLFAIENYVKVRAEYLKLEQYSAECENYIIDGRGGIKSHPIQNDMRQLRTQMFQYEKELGLNPSARARAASAAKDAGLTSTIAGPATGRKKG